MCPNHQPSQLASPLLSQPVLQTTRYLNAAIKAGETGSSPKKRSVMAAQKTDRVQACRSFCRLGLGIRMGVAETGPRKAGDALFTSLCLGRTSCAAISNLPLQDFHSPHPLTCALHDTLRPPLPVPPAALVRHCRPGQLDGDDVADQKGCLDVAVLHGVDRVQPKELVNLLDILTLQRPAPPRWAVSVRLAFYFLLSETTTTHTHHHPRFQALLDRAEELVLRKIPREGDAQGLPTRT